MDKNRIKKMNDDLLKKETKRKKKESEIFDAKAQKEKKKNNKKAVTWKEKFNKKYNQPLNKSNSLKEISSLTKISVKELKNIREKGEAAYFGDRKSVRPQVKNPTQWGIARIYSAVMGGPAARVDKEELKRGRSNFKK